MIIQEPRDNVKKLKLHLYVILLMLYFLIAPFEDVITSELLGTMSKYVAGGFVIVALYYLMLKKRIAFNSLSFIPLVLIFVSWCSVLWAIDAALAIDRNITYTLLPILFIIISMLDYNIYDLQQVEKAILFGGIVCLVISIWQNGLGGLFIQRFTLNERNDPNNLAALIYLPFCISVFWLNSKNKRYKLLNLLVSVALFIFIISTGSRGALLATVLFLVGYYFLGIKSASRINVKIIIMLVIAVAVVYFIIANILPETLISRLFTLNSYATEQNSMESRSFIWETIFTYIIPSFNWFDTIFGLGSGNAPIVLEEYFGYAKGVHNTYISMFLEYGVIGLSCFILFLSKIAKRLYTHESRFYFVCLLGMLIIIFFLDSYPKKFFWNVLFYAIIALKCKD